MMGGIICSLCHDREITTEKPRSGACSNGNDKIDVEKKGAYQGEVIDCWNKLAKLLILKFNVLR